MSEFELNFELNEESQSRIKRALEYVKSDARRAYTDQRISNDREDIVAALKAGIIISQNTGRYKKTVKVLQGENGK